MLGMVQYFIKYKTCIFAVHQFTGKHILVDIKAGTFFLLL